MQPAIREASAADVEEIARLHLASWSTAYRGIVSDEFLAGVTLESRITRWGQAVASSDSGTIVATEDGSILGVCHFGPRRKPPATSTGEVYALHIRPELRRRGVGKLLLDAAVTRMAQRGNDGAVLWVLRDNAQARRFYEAQGWSFTGEEFLENRSGYAIPETKYAITFRPSG
jgi:ribosomal protein S18 acetylase RimI-like enzyme